MAAILTNSQVKNLDLTCNKKKTIGTVFKSPRKDRSICSKFPLFKTGDSSVQFVYHFNYLGHFTTNNVSDNKDIQ